MGKAQIVGWAHGQFGKSPLENTEQLMASVLAPAMEHAGIEAADIDGIFVGVMNNGFSKQDFQAALVAMADERLTHTPAVRFENACATGSAAVATATSPTRCRRRWTRSGGRCGRTGLFRWVEGGLRRARRQRRSRTRRSRSADRRSGRTAPRRPRAGRAARCARRRSASETWCRSSATSAGCVAR